MGRGEDLRTRRRRQRCDTIPLLHPSLLTKPRTVGTENKVKLIVQTPLGCRHKTNLGKGVSVRITGGKGCKIDRTRTVRLKGRNVDHGKEVQPQKG